MNTRESQLAEIAVTPVTAAFDTPYMNGFQEVRLRLPHNPELSIEIDGDAPGVKDMYIGLLRTTPELRGAGIATRLLSAAAWVAISQGVETVNATLHPRILCGPSSDYSLIVL